MMPTGAPGSCPIHLGSDLEVGILDLHLRDDGSMVVGSISSRYVFDEVVGEVLAKQIPREVLRSWSGR